MTLNFPTAFRAKCEFCDNDLDIRAEGVCQYTSGWVMQREGGGGHGVSLPERFPRWAHRYCVERVARGFIKQKSLFDEQNTQG